MKRLIYIIIFLLPLTLTAQPKVKTWLSDDTVRFAQPVMLNISVTVPKTMPVKFPGFKSKELAKDLSIINRTIDTTANGDSQTLTLKLQLIPFDDTVFTIPSIPFTVGNDVVASDSLTLTVLPIEKDSAKLAAIDTSQVIDVFDVTGPLNAPVTFRELWLRFRYWLLGFLLVVLLVALVYWLYKKYKQHQANKNIPPEKQMSPYELALLKLNQLKDKQLHTKSKFKEFYSELSDILRQYIELRFHISAMELTTSELEALLANASFLDKDLYQGLITLLKNADLVKFAKYQPLPVVCENDLKFAFDFLEKTKPQPEPEETDPDTENNEQNTENPQQ